MFERGFKTWCERYAAQKRVELGLSASDPLDPYNLAQNLGIRVWKPADIPGITSEMLAILLRNDGKTASCWSAVTIVESGKSVVILNTSHSAGRQASDLMHELAHRIRAHKPREIEFSATGLMLVHEYDKAQEEEADWLSGCLLLPREALISIKRRGLDLPDAALAFGVSQRMLTYRLAMTGVNRQFG
ncbi:ImmA/IrrE family metallo-endopeptidase [Nevskia soli]|uniref:ImmA/IrrE family metallo-endopeptidase n=1 Tax=Nevskia soli TaxID=418856 RepID=UPI001B80DA61|nr:ImmA/IrrE family metallo-endopeptidase [Nevskia soli]